MENNILRTLDTNNSILLLVDYQHGLFDGIESHNCTDIKNNAIALAKGAQSLGILAVLTTFQAEVNGPFLPEIATILPDAEIINRKTHSFDVLDNPELLNALQNSGKKHLVLSGLWTNMCMCHTSLHGLRMGFDVLGVMDATGAEALEPHNAALLRMLQDGAMCTCPLEG
ncbi:MAG: isochorismatase family protein [Syntrophomonadaceae bacterium]|jgi:nicotinamidase-related amidase|nr:isochorismatase family protein [Syntrophomonadaceae bacterium]